MKAQEFYKLPGNYWLTSLIISGVTFLIFLFLTTKIKSFPLYFYTFFISATMSLLIGCEYAVLNYFLSNIHKIFKKLEPLFQGDQYNCFFENLNKRLNNSRLFYLTVIVVVAPFLIIELRDIGGYFNGQMTDYFYSHEPSPWSLLLDIINFILEYWTLFLLAVIVWTIIELTLIVNEMKGKYSIKINIFDVDDTGGFKPLVSFIMFILSSYFIIITLAVISYISPTATILFFISPKVVITYETSILSLMLLVGLILFITSQRTITCLIDKDLKPELHKINRIYEITHNKLIEINCNKQKDNKKEELEKLRTIVEILEKDEKKLKEINNKRFDLKATITFTATFLLPIFTIIKGIIEFSGLK